MSTRRVQAPRAGEQTLSNANYSTMSAGSICSREVDTANYSETVLDAARRMRDRQVGALIVVDDMTPVGILTDRDLTVRVLAVGETSLIPQTKRIVSSGGALTLEFRGTLRSHPS